MIESNTKFNDYTPDELRKLYKTNPNLFDELADDVIREACIGPTPEQTLKRRQMQWTIDAQLRKGKTPLERMQIMENIFYDQVYGDDGQLAQLRFSCMNFLRAARGTDHISAKKSKIYLIKK